MASNDTNDTITDEQIEADRKTTDDLMAAYKNGELIARHFRFAHLPLHLQYVSRRWAELALWVIQNLPREPERTVALRKLLESKDAAVRTQVPA